MKRFIGLLFIALSFSTLALAQDIFVRPKGDAKTPDMGIAPQQKTAPAPIVAAPAVTAQPPAQAPVEPPPPVQTNITPRQDTLPQAQNFSSPAFTTQNIGKDVSIIKISADNSPIPQGNGPFSLGLSIMPGAVGPADKRAVLRTLGLNEQEMTANCFIEYYILVATSEGGDYIPMRKNQSLNYRYGGSLSMVMISPSISCRKIKPPISGTVVEQNGFYTVSAQSFNCDVAGRTGSMNISFRYLGDGKGECK
jgi:hypothetical protein